MKNPGYSLGAVYAPGIMLWTCSKMNRYPVFLYSFILQ